MITTKDKIFLGLGFILVIILVVLGIVFAPRSTGDDEQIPTSTPSAQPFSGNVESVEPLMNQKGLSVAPQVVVNFSSPVAGRKVVLKSDPAAKFSVSADSTGTKITFNPKVNLKPGTKYNLQVLVDERSVFSWSFTTKSKGVPQQNFSSVIEKIKEKMPVVEPGFRISYDAAGDQFFVFIEKTPINTYKSKANDWFKKNGVKDLGALNINYVPKGSLTP